MFKIAKKDQNIAFTLGPITAVAKKLESLIATECQMRSVQVYLLGDCKTLWKELNTSQWVSESHFFCWGYPFMSVSTAIFACTSETFVEVDLTLLVSKTLIWCEKVIKLFVRGEMWLLRHSSLTLVDTTLAYNQLTVLFSCLIVSCPEMEGWYIWSADNK